MKQKHIPPRQTKGQSAPPKTSKKTSFEKLETALEKHHAKVLYGILSLSVIVSFLLFDIKLSVAGDDAAYIGRGWQFLHEGKFPYFQGPGYPLFLSIFISFLGMSVIPLKIVSLLCYNGFLFLVYFAFR